MTYFNYFTSYLLRAWVQCWAYNFSVWADLMTDNYAPYENFYGESSDRECHELFWASINTDEIYAKEFLEDLYQMVEDIDSGKVKTYPLDEVLDYLQK